MKIAFLFSGQGAQYPGMMKDIAEQVKEARDVFSAADKALQRGISELCFTGTAEELALTHNTQPCVMAADLAAYAAIAAAGLLPDVVAGFSLGEYAALVAAGVISVDEAFPLVQKRADFMQEAVPIGQGAMAAVMKLTGDEVNALCDEAEGYVIPANYNCPGQIVVSGEAEAVDRLLAAAKERKIRAIKLAVSAPFHCGLMRPAAEKLKEPLDQIPFRAPSVPVYMNVDAKAETEPDRIREKLVAQAMSPVRWEETLRNMAEAGINTFIELGPGKTLSGFVKKTLGDGVRICNVTDLESLQTTVSAVKGA
jgi:[acyl-carrier-protein] S-malonyltransferase